MNLPVKYDNLTSRKRRRVREEYIKIQDGLCYHCKKPLDGPPCVDVISKKVTGKLFPRNFFEYSVHLHHSHDTGLTIGAVHCYCNAVLWEYYGE